MEAVGTNRRLKEARIANGLSLKEAAYKLNIFIITLYLYEEGYLIVKQKHFDRFINTYDLPADFFLEYPYYPTAEPAPIKKEGRLRKISRTIWFKIGCGVFVLGSVALIVAGYFSVGRTTENVLSFYSNNSLALRENVIENGVPVESKLDDDAHYLQDEIDTITTRVYIYDSPDRLKFSYIDSTDYDEDKKPKVHFTLVTNQNGAYCYVAAEGLYEADFLYSDDRYSIVAIYNEKKVQLTDQDADYYILAGLGLSALKANINTINTSVAKIANISSYSATTFLADIIDGNNKFSTAFGTAVAMTAVGGVLLGLSFFALSFSIIQLINEKNASFAKKIDIDLSNEDEQIKHSKEEEIPKNIKFPFFIPDSVLKIGIVVLILFASLAMYSFFSYWLAVVGIGPQKQFDIGKYTSLFNFYKFAPSLLSIATILAMFNKIDVYIETKSYIKSAAKMFLAGLLFYTLETIIVFGTMSGLNNLALVTAIIADYLPGNLFWGMGVYALFALFLFTTPKIFEKKRKYRIIWKSLIAIPVLYLFISLLYSCLTKAGVWPRLPYYVAFLLYPKNLAVSMFVLFFCLAVYYCRYQIIKKYGHEYAEILYNSNRYILYKNTVASLLVLIIGLVDLIIYFTAKDNAYVSALGLGKNFYILIAIPIIFFYRPHIGERSVKFDNFYTFAYGFSYSIGYILLVFILLPYVSYLQPLIDYLLK